MNLFFVPSNNLMFEIWMSIKGIGVAIASLKGCFNGFFGAIFTVGIGLD
jgi:hypothetical protein